MAKSTIKATRREGAGKGAARKLRGTGKVPAILYGHGDRTEALTLDAHELDLFLHQPHGGLIRLDVEGRTTDVLIREIQRHPYKPEVLHVDFLQLHADEVVKLQVPVRLLGTAAGVLNDGGVLDQVIYDVEVESLPGDIPEAAEVDVSHLGLGESVRVRDLTAGKATVLADPDLPVASVLAPRVDAEGDAGEAPEPEVLRARAAEDE